MSDLAYDNRTGRPPGRVVRALGRVLPGVAQVQRQVEPYADHWAAANRATLASPSGRRRWVVLGDSMSVGVGASSPGAGWVGQLHERLRGAGHDLEVLNLAATGARVPDVVEQQLPALAALGSAGLGSARPQPDLVTVLIGSNDLFGGRAHRDGLGSSMSRLVTLLPRGAVVSTLPQPRAAARAANVHLEEGAARGRLRLVDLRVDGPATWRGRLAPDRFHPNDAGYAALADAFEPVVLRALEDSDADERDTA